MKKPTDINTYKNEAYLELCLSMVEEGYRSLQADNPELAKAQLRDILEVFDKIDEPEKINATAGEVIAFPVTVALGDKE